jgi:hypothetical protein
MELKSWQKELLEKGNRSVFAEIFCTKYPEIAKKQGFKKMDYNSWVDWNEEDKIFTVWNKNGDKDFFNTSFEFLGRKEY